MIVTMCLKHSQTNDDIFLFVGGEIMITLREIVNSVVIKRSVLADSLDKILEESTGYSPRQAIME